MAAPTGVYDYSGVALRRGEWVGMSFSGTVWALDETGRRWLVKTYGGDADRVATELLANAVYRAMGANVPRAGAWRAGSSVALAYPVQPGEPRLIEAPSRALGEHFMTDALVANWDFLGEADTNVLWQGGHPLRIDQGGTFFYRAQGGSKPFGPVPSEVWTLRQPGVGQGFGKVEVSEDATRGQASRIRETLTDAVVAALVDAAPFDDLVMRDACLAALKRRVAWMGEFGAGRPVQPACTPSIECGAA